MTDLLDQIVGAVHEICEDPALDRPGTYAYGQRVLAKRLTNRINQLVEDDQCQRMQPPTSPPKA